MRGEKISLGKNKKKYGKSSKAKDTIGENDQLLRILINSTGEGIYSVDMKGNCTFANNACVKILGFESDADLLGKHMHNLVHHTRPNGEPYPVEECRIYQAFRNREGTHVDDEVMFNSHGKPFPAEYWSYPIESDGELVGCVVTFVDISERKRAEKLINEADEIISEIQSAEEHGSKEGIINAAKKCKELRLKFNVMRDVMGGLDIETIKKL